MRSKQVINFIVSFFLFVPALQAQKGTLSIVPELGFQIPFAKNSFIGYTKGTLINNDIWAVPGYGVSISYQLKNNSYILLRFLNGQAGYAMGVKSNIPCENGYNGSYSDRYQASSYNEKRFILGIELPISKSNKSKNFSLSTSFQTGIGLDFKSSEIDSGKIFFPGTNRCGEEFYLRDSIYNRFKMGFILPFQINLIANHKYKRRLQLSMFFHLGLSKHYNVDIDYVTQSYVEKATFIVRGTSFGLVLSYPINVFRFKK